MESGIDPGQDYYTQDYYNYDHGYDLPQYGSRRKLISPSGLYDEYGEVVVDDDGSYYYSPQESDGEVRRQFPGGRLAPHPAHLQPRPHPVPPPRKPPGAPGGEGDLKHPSEGATAVNAKSKDSSVAARLKVGLRVSTLQSTHGSRKRRIKLVVDREYETSSTGEDSLPETQRGRLSSALNSHANVNGSVYMAQNGSIIRTRRSANATGPAHAHTHAHATTNNNLKLTSPVFSSRLAKHFKKLDRMAATLEERVPLNNPRAPADGGGNTLRTFQGSGLATPATAPSPLPNADNNKTLNVLNARQSDVSLGSAGTGGAGPESAASKSNLLKAAQGGAEHQQQQQQPQSAAERDELSEGERESKVDCGNGEEEEEEEEEGRVKVEPLECPSDRTQSDEEELWMGPWNSLHIPMTKL